MPSVFSCAQDVCRGWGVSLWLLRFVDRGVVQLESRVKLAVVVNSTTLDVCAVECNVVPQEGSLTLPAEHSKVYEIHCTTYQMSVLLLFNSVPPSGCLTVNDIRETLKLDEMLLILHLDVCANLSHQDFFHYHRFPPFSSLLLVIPSS